MRSPLTPQLGWSSVFQSDQCFRQLSVSASSVFQAAQCFSQFSVSGSSVFQSVQCFRPFSVSVGSAFQAGLVLQVVQCLEGFRVLG